MLLSRQILFMVALSVILFLLKIPSVAEENTSSSSDTAASAIIESFSSSE